MNLSARDYPVFRNVDFLTLLSMIFDRKDFLTSLFSTRLVSIGLDISQSFFIACMTLRTLTI